MSPHGLLRAAPLAQLAAAFVGARLRRRAVQVAEDRAEVEAIVPVARSDSQTVPRGQTRELGVDDGPQVRQVEALVTQFGRMPV